MDLERRALWLIKTSVEDCKSGLSGYGVESLPVLKRALEIAETRRHKTRANYLRSKIRQLTKQQEAPKC